MIVARLGDESAGESLTAAHRADQRVSIVASFDPANHTDERGTRVDLDGAPARSSGRPGSARRWPSSSADPKP